MVVVVLQVVGDVDTDTGFGCYVAARVDADNELDKMAVYHRVIAIVNRNKDKYIANHDAETSQVCYQTGSPSP